MFKYQGTGIIFVYLFIFSFFDLLTPIKWWYQIKYVLSYILFYYPESLPFSKHLYKKNIVKNVIDIVGRLLYLHFILYLIQHNMLRTEWIIETGISTKAFWRTAYTCNAPETSLRPITARDDAYPDRGHARGLYVLWGAVLYHKPVGCPISGARYLT